MTFIDSVRVIKPGESPDPVGLPVSATAIVLGTVTIGKAIVSKSRDLVYSDYEVEVTQVLKSDLERPINPQSQITVWRRGGSIHFPSGHLRHFLISGEGFPALGGQYVFFLWRTDSRLAEYAIGTAYGLSGGVTTALDSANESGPFEGKARSDFLTKMKIQLEPSFVFNA